MVVNLRISEESWLIHPTSLCALHPVLNINQRMFPVSSWHPIQTDDGWSTNWAISLLSSLPLSASSRYEQMIYIWTISSYWLSFNFLLWQCILFFLTRAIDCRIFTVQQLVPLIFPFSFALKLSSSSYPIILAVPSCCFCIQRGKM